MNNIIKLNAQNCQNCFKCIRECPLKAIEFKDGKTNIIEDERVHKENTADNQSGKD